MSGYAYQLMEVDMEDKKYKLSTTTLKDIIDKIPPEKWDEVFGEMIDAVKQIKGTMDAVSMMVEAISEASGESVNMSEVLKFPDEITWIDDGLGVNTVGFINGDTGERHGEIKFECGSKK
jgi:hypothetical protein